MYPTGLHGTNKLYCLPRWALLYLIFNTPLCVKTLNNVDNNIWFTKYIIALMSNYYTPALFNLYKL